MKRISGNQLKIIGLLAMTCDHVAVLMFPQCLLLRSIGRLALPIFAYMIAEGCRYTKNRKQYLLKIFAVAMLCQAVYWFAERSLYQCILVTFSVSVCWIYTIDYAKEKKTAGSGVLVAVVSAAISVVSILLPEWVKEYSNFQIDYGIWGILMPVIIYYSPDPYKLPATLLAQLPLCLERGGFQWWSLAVALPLLLYSGKRGKVNMKHLFYIYYPTHLAAIYLIRMLLQA